MKIGYREIQKTYKDDIKKLAIISEFSRNNANYGNRLQSVALNRYLLKRYPSCQIEYLYFDFYEKYLQTKRRNLRELVARIIKGIRRRTEKYNKPYKGNEQRLAACEAFSIRNMTLSSKPYVWEELEHSDFDAIIVGSDVVWAQGRFQIGRRRFLDFTTSRPFARISYAASFGRDWIPEENVADIKRCLSKFQAISVREASSVELLRKLGISAVHTLDPTLLLSAEEWENMEEEPVDMENWTASQSGGINPSDRSKEEYGTLPYIFTYLLGTDGDMRKKIVEWAHSKGYQVITIPYASGFYNNVDKEYGDIRLLDCSPENWLWLVHHADYVVTDSFHGTAFSTIFEKRFVVLERKMEVNINNRMIDFLKTIQQSDKMIPYTELERIEGMQWEYKKINELLSEKRTFSEEFLRSALDMIGWKEK